ncbi:poly [ADP-ribose] polymerase 9 [Poecilia reticulata]|uniref:Poly [ADP-ribose] polymerase 9 n=1 Tax=Poecilia reticulata TaxID=8081 RepID=A0A3P9Q2P6_POERE|nr:PREDICTED: poly [ADP-ribose] polymerase 9 [Poecilia reticulata]
MTSKLDIPLHEASLSIVRRCGAELCEIVNSKFGCVAAIEGVENESRTSFWRPPATIKPERRYEFMMRSGVKVSVWKADLTNFSADAVVNAANEDLHHYGGLALALSDAGGPQIQKESDDYIRKHGKLQTGEAVALGPGSLPCKKIIHAVGPYLPPNPPKYDLSKAKPFLEKAILNILDKVEKYHLATVAIPAISSGLFNYPLPECANTIVSTIKNYYDNLPYQNHRPKEIFLANHDDPTVQEMEKACNGIFVPQQKQSYSNAVAQNTRSAGNAPQPSVTIGNVCLTLMKGKIEEQRTDVIVNTASVDRVLSIGKISSAILNKAGYGIQNEIKRAQKKGYIIRTQPYKLSCKEVFHTFCTDKAHDPAANQVLYGSVLDCLRMAAAQQYNSITFPAIGTGALGFTKVESASIMLTAVSAFAQNCLNRMHVHFVIFPSDRDTFQAFEWEIGLLQQRSATFNFPPEITGADGKSRHRSHHQHPPAYSGDQHRTEASWNKDDSHSSRAPAPQISLVCPNEESKHEAERWLKNGLSMDSHSFKIYNNFLSHFSDHDHLQLAVSAEKGLIVEEFFSKGHACLEINGDSKEEVAIAGFKVEAMLCKVQKEFIREEEHELQMLSNTEPSHQRKTVEKSSKEFSSRREAFNRTLRVTKVEKVENAALKAMFDMKKKQLDCPSKPMIQRIPAQFCEMISRIGFHAECAPPEDPKYGEGIYFTRNIKTALELWKEKSEEYLYFVEAEVLLGNSAKGEPGFILPPPVGKDPNVLYDSVSGGSDVSVIFSGYQALPKYIIWAKKDSHSSYI